jgi:hypothetical protein
VQKQRRLIKRFMKLPDISLVQTQAKKKCAEPDRNLQHCQPTNILLGKKPCYYGESYQAKQRAADWSYRKAEYFA